jgi:hypothetical protein
LASSRVRKDPAYVSQSYRVPKGPGLRVSIVRSVRLQPDLTHDTYQPDLTHDAYRLEVAGRWPVTSFTIRQLFMSATYNSFSDGHASPCGQLNCPV